MAIIPKIETIKNLLIKFNVGAGLDIPNGAPELGIHGETIINGGMPPMSCIVGLGNNFKSTILHYITLSALAKTKDGIVITYDTEVNIEEYHLREQINSIENLSNTIIDDKRWLITSAIEMSGDEFFDFMKDYMLNVKKDEVMQNTPFYDKTTKKLIKILTPTFLETDSMSGFETKDVTKMTDAHGLGDGKANTKDMNLGKHKKRYITETFKLCKQTMTYHSLTGHMGEVIVIDQYKQPVKKLRDLKNLVIKGIPDSINYLTNIMYNAFNAAKLVNTSTKEIEYPESESDSHLGSCDLYLVSLMPLRNKTGKTGEIMNLVVSQSKGVLSGLTEFHYIRSNGFFGINGKGANMTLQLYPEVRFSRMNVRKFLNEDPKFRRAVNITAELLQLSRWWDKNTRFDYSSLCAPDVLYEDIKKLGYEWETLYNTRGWWCMEGACETPFLSTIDLLNMRKGTYKPYWLKDKKK